ncbi:hypothetical protein [Burkholderia ambifaria]|uniref:hypothetical protein n=1 Tax=Burkholderia ambifaria TaxID=152480 RepID=UPI00158D4C3F|nr:hypothetical protein [Burkholderia ambifaria]
MPDPLTRYPQEAHWFDDQLPIVNEHPDRQAAHAVNPIEAVFGRAAVARLLPLSLLHFAGGFVGSAVSCWAGSWEGLEPATPQDSVLYLRVSHPDWIVPGMYNQVRLYRNESGNPEMYVDQLYLRRDATPRGLGTLTFWRMVRAAQLTGVASIRLAAAGGRFAPPFFGNQRWDGYRFWPLLGFDGALADTDREFFRNNFFDHPVGIHAATTVQHVLSLDDGAAFWKHCGGYVPECRFATASGSASMMTLSARVEALFGVRP